MTRAILASIFLFVTVLPLQAQDIVGRALIDGRTVELLDDGTWRYAQSSGSGGCDPLKLGLSFCGTGSGWTKTQVPNADVHAAWRRNDRTYGMVILEGLGSDQGMTADFMRNMVIENAAFLTGTQPESIPIIDVYPVSIGDLPGEVIVYPLNIEGLKVVYANAIFSMPSRTFQVLHMTVGTEFTDEARASAAEFLSLMRHE